jgi:hypothetical protein
MFLPTTNHQPPTTNHQPPTTNHQPPTTNHQPPITNHRFKKKGLFAVDHSFLESDLCEQP